MKCPRCEYPRMKTWDELNSDEKFIVERLPKSAEFSVRERKQHLFCPRCQLEFVDDAARLI